MTNAEIIFKASMNLLNAGKIKGTGRMMTVITEEGETQMPEPEAIHTFAHWKELGFQVRKGEHAVAVFPIWKYTKKAAGKTEEEAQEEGYCFMKIAYWFTAAQVDAI